LYIFSGVIRANQLRGYAHFGIDVPTMVICT